MALATGILVAIDPERSSCRRARLGGATPGRELSGEIRSWSWGGSALLMPINDEPVQAWRCKNQIPGCQEAAAASFRQRLSEILRGPESTRQPVERVGTC